MPANRPPRRKAKPPETPLEPPSAARRNRLGTLALAASLAVAVLAAHWPVLSAGALALDDDLFVVRNPLVQRPGWESTRRFFVEVTKPSTVSAYYLPLSMTSLMLDWAAGGRPERLLPFHVTSLTLHLIATLLLFLILRRLLGCGIPAALAALLWAVHPLMVEPIASAGERKTVLATAFAFASILGHVRFAEARSVRWRALSLACFALALLSKPSALTLPLALVVLDAWPLRRLSRETLLEKWPHALLAASAAVISVLAVRNTWEFGPPPPLDPVRMLTQVAWLQGFYLGKVFWPGALATVYEAPARYTLADPGVAWPVASALLVAAACWALRKRAPGLWTGGLVYFVLLAPTFAILRYSGVIAYDRYLHLPAFGLALALAASVTPAWRSPSAGRRALRVAISVGLLALACAAAVATRTTLGHWRDTLGLKQNAVRVSPGVPDAWNSLGVTYSGRGEREQAIECYRRAIAVGPQYVDAHHNLGRELSLLGRVNEAIPYLEFAVAHAPGNAQSLLQLGVAYQRAGRMADAEAVCRRALELKPESVPALLQLGAIEAAQGRTDEAIARLRRALALAPGEPLASFALASAIALRSGPTAEVVRLLRQAIEGKPGWPDPVNELAWLQATAADPALRDPAQALRLAERAVALTRTPDPNVLDTMAAALAALRRFDEASATAERALALAREQGADSLAIGIERRLRSYRRGRPFVQISPADR